jgi:hypothetical protein
MPFDPREPFDDSPPEYVDYSFALAHDWTLGIGEWTFGINEVDLSGARAEDFGPRTNVYVGPTQFSTTFSAYEVLLVGVLSLLILVPAVFHTVARIVGRSKLAE